MDLKETARAIFIESVRAADPYGGIKRFVKMEGDDIVIDGERYPSGQYNKVVVVGGGKASARMGQALEEVLGDRIEAGWINTKYDHVVPLRKITLQECGHPVPDAQGIEGSRKIVELLRAADERTLVICLLSGGGSALMPAPAEGITLEEKQEVTKLLLSAGADIEEINAVRKHLSLLKGGGMAQLAAPARLHVLILSDVIGDRLDTIASGPAVADRTTFPECIEICARYHILEKLPPAARNRLLEGVRGKVPETAKEGDPYLAFARNTLVGNNRMSVEAARVMAVRQGFHTLILSTVIEGEAREVGTVYAALASEIESSGNPIPMPACIIGGGEPTVTIRGKGKGGRNLEMAVKVAEHIAGMEDTVFLSGGTDGTDGPTDAAGGIVDGMTFAIGKKNGLDVHATLADNDSYHYVKAVDGLVLTGPTGTNVMDIHILLVGKPG
jgi:glycerate-2-kinase